MRRALLLALLLVPLAWAGTEADPEVTDPSGDQSGAGTGDPTLVGTGFPANSWDELDILAAWVTSDSSSFQIHVRTTGDIHSEATYDATFALATTAAAAFNSTVGPADAIALSATGGSATGPEGTTVSSGGSELIWDVPLASVGVAGGEELRDLSISASRSDDGGATALDDQAGSDDAGPGTTYTFPRDPVTAAVTLTVLGAELLPTGTATGDSFDVTNTTEAQVSIAVVNTGSDADNVTLTATTGSFDMATLDLTPGEGATVVLTIFTGGMSSTEYIDVLASSARGASASAQLELIVEEPTVGNTGTNTNGTPTNATGEREPILAVGFLTSTAEAMGFDELFGDAAELVLLALIILLLVLLVFLILMLVRTGWVKVKITPKRMTVAPGETAEFEVEVHNRKRRFHEVDAEIDDGDWVSGLLLKQDGGRAIPPVTSNSPGRFDMISRKEPGDHYKGTLRVKAPSTPGSSTVDLNFTPHADGVARRSTKARVKVTAAAAPVASSEDIRLADIHHEPQNPDPEEEVLTTATIENDSADGAATVRVVLELDGEEADEEVLTIPAKSAKAVQFPWVAEEGSNRVRVLVYPA